MHGVRRRLIEDQADALGLPVQFVVIPHPTDPTCPMAHNRPGTTFPPNDTYTRAMLEAFEQLKAERTEVVVFGDIFLEDLRAFRDRLLGVAGLAGCYPLWGRDSAELCWQFIDLGFKAVCVCVDTNRLSLEYCGRFFNADFIDLLPMNVDPCGERGEYHSFTFDGPLFREPIKFQMGDVHRDDPFAFQELYPVPAVSAGSSPQCRAAP
jgi:uncharacterized protein (TIGR00290 family)